MGAAAWQPTNTTRSKILSGQFVYTDSYKVALFTSNSNIDATRAAFTDLTGEVGVTNTNYFPGGLPVELAVTGTTSVDLTFVAPPAWTPSTAGLVCKTAVLYEIGGDIVGFCPLETDGDLVVPYGQTLTVPGPLFRLSTIAGNWTLTDTTITKLLSGQFVVGDTYKLALFTAASNLDSASTTYAGLTGQVGTTNTGYSTGGASITLAAAGTTSIPLRWTGNPTWTAGSANLTAKWAVLYEVGGDVFAYTLLDPGGSSVTTNAGQQLTIDADGTPQPVLTFA